VQNSRKTSRAVYDIKYHAVWSAKYRKNVLYDRWQNGLRELMREICKGNDIGIVKGSISKDDVHLFISVPPFLSVSKLVHLSIPERERPHTNCFRNSTNSGELS
jgi:putative transposase